MAKEKKNQAADESLSTNEKLKLLLKAINKDVGGGSVIKGRNAIVGVSAFSTGVAALDKVLGIWGIPIGRIIEIYGPESGGKTTTCLHLIKACQRHYYEDKGRYGVAVFIDAEHAFDPRWAERIGVDIEELIIAQPESGEEVFEIAQKFAESGLVDLIVVDSVAALLPKEILEGEMDAANMGALARVMSKGLNKLKGPCSVNKTTAIFINQLREKLGVMFGNPEVTPGGRALKFYSSIRMEIKKVSPIKEKDDIYAFRTRAKVIKNKVAPPFEEHEFDICIGKPQRKVYGIDETYSLLEIALEDGVCTKNGNFVYFDKENLGNGVGAAVECLRKNAVLREAIRDALYSQAKAKLVIVPESEDDLVDPILDGDV
jgi:recombination protein RecA